MRILFIGDIVGRSGRAVVLERLPGLVRDWKLDFVAINGENAAGGFGITEAIYQDLVDAGADVDHRRQPLLGPARGAGVHRARAASCCARSTIPPGTPGRGAALIEAKNGARVLVVNVMGRIFMDPLDDPFAAIERELSPARCGAMPTRSWSTCTARPPARSRRWVTSATAARASWSALTPMRRPPIIRSCRAARPSSRTSA